MATKKNKVPRNRKSRTSAFLNPVRAINHPVFAQPIPTEDPTMFRIPHASDNAAYKIIDELNKEHKLQALPFPSPRGGVEPQLTLQDALGGDASAIQKITAAGQIVFHATGDCGSTKGPQTQNLVVDKMLSDFNETDSAEIPQYHLLLGDIVYSFGESQYYYDQFYDPYRDYPGPIFAAAGNHDGMVSPLAHAKSLDAYLKNFCANSFGVTADAGGLSRTAQIQPGVFFTLNAPFVRTLVLYSNALEDPGVISDAIIGRSQLDFLEAALNRVKSEKYAGALLIADHHPPYAVGSQHGWSIDMLAQIDAICKKVGVWPHAFLSGHTHNYQRFTRTRPNGEQIPYIICGNGGHDVLRFTKKGAAPIRAPQIIQAATSTLDQVILENYDDVNYGYLRITVNKSQLRIEYHPASDGPQSKTPDDSVTVDLQTHMLTQFAAKDLGRIKAMNQIRNCKRSAR